MRFHEPLFGRCVGATIGFTGCADLLTCCYDISTNTSLAMIVCIAIIGRQVRKTANESFRTCFSTTEFLRGRLSESPFRLLCAPAATLCTDLRHFGRRVIPFLSDDTWFVKLLLLLPLNQTKQTFQLGRINIGKGGAAQPPAEWRSGAWILPDHGHHRSA